MPETAAPKFSCPSCGKQFRWKPELAGKKGKCACGGVLSIPATPPATATRSAPPPPPPAPPPPPVERNPLDDEYALAEEPIEPPKSYARPAGAAAASSTVMQAGRSPVVVTREDDDEGGGGGRELNIGGALKWFGIGAVAAALAVWEFSSPTDPEARGRRRGLRALLVLANHIHPRGAFFLLAAFAAFMLVVGVLILLGKAKDDDSEHEKNKDQWPASRGKR